MKKIIRPHTQSELYTGNSKPYRTSVASRKDDTVKDFSLKIIDIDTAIKYYFKNVVKPSVIERNKRIDVPILYGKPSRWITIRKFGYLRDKKNKIMLPVIVYRNTGIERNKDLIMNKLDANNPQLFYPVIKKWSQKNAYSNFSVLHKESPVKEIYEVVVPEYIILTYEGIILTNTVAQTNSLVESFLYSENSYWGEENKFKFLTLFNGSFGKSEEVATGEDKIVKTTFNMTVYGHIVPDSINKEIAMKERNQKTYSSFKLILGEEQVVSDINKIK